MESQNETFLVADSGIKFQFKIKIMSERISKWEKFKMQNPILQFVKFLFLNVKIMTIVGKGHGGTRGNEYVKEN
jgi:hypothetical protein